MIPTSSTTGKAAPDNGRIDASSGGERSGIGEGGVGRKLIANTLFNFLGQLYVLVLAFAVVPYIVHHLGPELYGLIAVVATLGGFAGLLNLGVGRALSKYVAELYWQGELGRIRALFGTALGTSLVAGAVGFLLLIGFRNSFAGAFFHGDPSTDRFVTFALLVTAFGVLISMATEPLSALPLAIQRFDICNRMSVLLATLRNFGAVLVLILGLFVKGVLLMYLFASLVVFFCYVYYGRKLVPNLSLRPRFSWGDFKYLFSFSASVLVLSVSSLVVHRLDRVLVAYFLPIAAVAYYVIPYSLAANTWTGVGNITSVIFPSASELSAMQANEKLRELYLRATKMVVLVGLPVTVILVVVPRQILQYWVGPEFAQHGALTLQLLAGGCFFNILAHVPMVVSQGIGRPWIAAKYSLINGVANLGLFLLLIPRLGVVGAGLSFFLSQVLIAPPYVWEVNRQLSVSWWSLISSAYLRPLACALGATAFLVILRPYIDSLPKLLLYCGFTISAYGLLALVYAIDRREKMGIFEQALSALRSLRCAVGA
jgi:O-antigen/teichoic acid export membrane protein